MPLLNIVVTLVVVGVVLHLINRFIPMASSNKSILNIVVGSRMRLAIASDRTMGRSRWLPDRSVTCRVPDGLGRVFRLEGVAPEYQAPPAVS